ncbi:ROK family protein [Mesobacillus maritimus]|uniref:ROK family protein n=1 Tax=Mesobacillus maritimus TaxID=1643336 RepID=UPI00203AE554|nr:ROK family protein [Mesobacillus maritimus]MCM3585310.1 ROK family protein [Mesobacillus maritimus]
MLLGVIDIGGTSIKYGVLNEQGELLSHNSTPTEAIKGGKSIVEKLFVICEDWMKQYSLEGIAISTAGQIDPYQGKVVFAADTIPDYTDTPLAELLKQHTGLPVTVENDVNCTALGEYWKGAARGVNDFLCVTIGTGIGGGLFLNGELYRGARFAAGEIGHISLYPDGKPCTCGHRGCYEQYASSSALAKLVEKELGSNISLIQFFDIVKQEEPQAVAIFNGWIEDVTSGLQTLVHLFNPKLVVIGGGISAQGEFLLNAIKNSLDKKLTPNHRKGLTLKMAEHENQANLLGAAKHFYMLHSS